MSIRLHIFDAWDRAGVTSDSLAFSTDEAVERLDQAWRAAGSPPGVHVTIGFDRPIVCYETAVVSANYLPENLLNIARRLLTP